MGILQLKTVPIAPKRRYGASGMGLAVGKSSAKYSRRLAYSEENLIISISNTLAIHKQDIREARTLLGKIIGLVSRPVDPENIKIDGTRLMQLLDLSQSPPPIKLSASAEYLVDSASLIKLLSKAKKHMKKD